MVTKIHITRVPLDIKTKKSHQSSVHENCIWKLNHNGENFDTFEVHVGQIFLKKNTLKKKGLIVQTREKA